MTFCHLRILKTQAIITTQANPLKEEHDDQCIKTETSGSYIIYVCYVFKILVHKALVQIFLDVSRKISDMVVEIC